MLRVVILSLAGSERVARLTLAALLASMDEDVCPLPVTATRVHRLGRHAVLVDQAKQYGKNREWFWWNDPKSSVYRRTRAHSQPETDSFTWRHLGTKTTTLPVGLFIT